MVPRTYAAIFGQPNDLRHGRLKRIGRYLVGHGRLVYEDLFQDSPSELTTYGDTDFAGSTVTRRSTPGRCMMMGQNFVKRWNKTRSAIALPSGEAELGVSLMVCLNLLVCSLYVPT